MKRSKNNPLSSSLFFNLKKRIEIIFKNCFPNNKTYVDNPTQTDVFCDLFDQDLIDSTKILLSPKILDQGIKNKPEEEIKAISEETIKQEPQTNRSSNKFVEDSQFSRIIKSYSLINSSNYFPLNLNNGLMYQPIYAEGHSPAELELKSFEATLKCYRNILSFQTNPIYKGFQWSSKVDFFSSSNSESLFRPIKSEVKFSPTIDEPSTTLKKPNLTNHRITRILAL